jgi:hypothetical protein
VSPPRCSCLAVIWGGGYDFQKGYTRDSVSKASGFVPMDWTSNGYVGPMFLYMFYGFYDGKGGPKPGQRISADPHSCLADLRLLVYGVGLGPLADRSSPAGLLADDETAPSPTTPASWPTSSDSTRASSLPAPQSSRPSTMTGCHTSTSSPPPGLSWRGVCWSPRRSSSSRCKVRHPLHHGATPRREVWLTTRAESVSIEEDLKFSDETIEDVKPLGIGVEMTSEK